MDLRAYAFFPFTKPGAHDKITMDYEDEKFASMPNWGVEAPVRWVCIVEKKDNKTHDRRFARTEKDITSAAIRLLNQKSFDIITTADILRESGYCKAAFYSHFRNKDDCYKKIIDGEVAFCIDCFYRQYQKSYPIRFEMYYDYFTHVYENKSFYTPLFTEYATLYLYFFLKIREETLNKFRYAVENNLAELYAYSKIHGMLGAIDYWIKNGYNPTPREFTQLFCTDISPEKIHTK
jgi:AcrR family transcriptional regulator